MKITLGSSTLVEEQKRSANGSPVGPSNLVLALSPGVVLREYVGADRVQGEHVKCDHGSVTFGVERIFDSPESALAYMRGGFLSEASEGKLTFGDQTVFEHAAVTSRQAALVGCAVAVSYTIEG